VINHDLVAAAAQTPHHVVQASLFRPKFPPQANCSGNVCVTDELELKFFGLTFDINTLWSTVLAAGIVAGLGFYVRKRLTSQTPGRIQLFFETVIGSIRDQAEGRLGPAGWPVVPLATCLFVFILVCNWFEIFWPFGHAPNYLPTPTSNVNLCYGMALTVFVYTNYTAIKRAGWRRYMGHFSRYGKLLAPFQVVEEIAKPLSLSLRLFGNVFTGALVLALIAGLFPLFIIPFADVIWVPFDLFIFAIQAFIFALLTIIYYQEAVAISEEGH
jgi:F-type H+-transporting ATPase subunit a